MGRGQGARAMPPPVSRDPPVLSPKGHKIAGGELYELCLRMPGGDWFAPGRMAQRLGLAAALFAFHLLTSPLALARYTWEVHRLWYSAPVAAVQVALLPLTPLLFLMWVVIGRAQAAAAAAVNGKPPPVCDADIWAKKPDGFLTGVLFDWLREFQNYVTFFTQLGCAEPKAVSSFRDEPLGKTFWRQQVFDHADVPYPRAVARWDGARLQWEHPLREGLDLLVKLDESFFGAGDRLLSQGSDFRVPRDVEAAVNAESEYNGRKGLVLEFARPRASLGVHSLDIITVRSVSPDGGEPQYDVACCVLWTACTGPTSHSATEGYAVDVRTETVVDTLHWYSAYFRDQPSTLIGTKLDGIREACIKATQAHERAAQLRPWLTSVGWDCMLTPRGGMTFFEGNIALFRLPRRIIASPAHLMAFLRTFRSQHHLVCGEEE